MSYLPFPVELESTLLLRFRESKEISDETGTLICEAPVPVEDIITLAYLFVNLTTFCER